MPKRKQKAKKHRFYSIHPRALVVAAVFVLVGLPASWLAVNAQSANTATESSTNDDMSAAESSGEGNATGTSSTDKPAANSAETQKGSTAQKTASKPSKAVATPVTNKPAASTPPAAAPAPTPPPVYSASGWHSNVISTVFWVGEAAGPENAGISNAMSAWDGNWETNYGGYDDPDNRNGYHPAGFTPKENPFYFALPYNDLDENGNRKETAVHCPNTGSSISWCKNAWIKIVKGNKTAYAQWQDVGPLQEDDATYVFGSAAPKNTWGAKAGLDVSPAVRDYLGLGGIDTVSWGFVSASSVPAGPWKDIVTTNVGGW